MIKTLSRIFHSAYFLVLLAVIAAVCATLCGNRLELPLRLAEYDPVSIPAGAFLLLAVGYGYYIFSKGKADLSGKQINILYAAAALLITAVQLFIIFELKNIPTSDSRFIDNAARAYAQGRDFSDAVQATEKHTTYFYQFPNNWAVLMILSVFYKAVNAVMGEIPVYAAGLLNTAFIQLGLFFMFKCARLVFKNNRKTALCIILMLGYAPLYTYSCYLYTDSLSMPFVSAAVYLVIKAVKAESTKGFFGLCAAAAAVTAAGYSVKGSLAVIIIASIIYLAANVPVKRFIPAAAMLIAATVVFNSVVIHGIAIGSGIATEEKLDAYRFPMTHWVMMGLKNEGGFDVDDHNFTKYQPDYETRKKESIRVIKERISESSAGDMSLHIFKKLGFTWGDGTYYIKNHIRSARNGTLKYIIGKGTKALIYFQSYHLMIILAMAASVLSGIRNGGKSSMSYIRLAVFGITVFLLIWETRSRYLFNFIPLMLIMAADGIAYAPSAAEKILNKRKDPQIS